LLIVSICVFSATIFADLGATPDSEKLHTVVKDDTLANISFKYYSKSDRERGAHWIHIYEYSIDKNLIDPVKQPIVPYGKKDARVNIFVDKKVAIPFFKGQYPSANELLNKYGFRLADDGYSVEQIETYLPINIGVEGSSEKTTNKDKVPFWVGNYQANVDSAIKEVEDAKAKQIERIKMLFENYQIQLNEDMTLTIITSNGSIVKGTIKDNGDGTLTFTITGMDPLLVTVKDNKKVTIVVEPIKVGDNVYFVFDSGEVKLTFSTGVQFWVGEYKADVDFYIEQLSKGLSEAEKKALKAKFDNIKPLIDGYTITLGSDYKVTTTMGGEYKTGTISENADGSLNLNIEGKKALKVMPLQEKEKGVIYFTISDDNMLIKFVKIK